MKKGENKSVLTFIILSDSKAVIFLQLSEFVVRTKHILDLLFVHFSHVGTCNLAVLTWIKVIRMICQSLTNAGSVSQTRVRVDVNLTYSAL